MRKPNACCDNKDGLKKGPWTSEEDKKLLDFIERHGHGSWRSLPEKAGLQRCGKSCRLRWRNYLRPDIKRGKFTWHEEQTIIQLHALLGNRWSAIANMLPKRTDNEIKNHWNTHLKKRLIKMGIDPVTHKPKTNAQDDGASNANLNHIAQWESARVEAEARLAKESKLITMTTTSSNIPNYKLRMSKAGQFRPLLSSTTTTTSWKNKQQPLLFIPPLRLEDYIFKAGQPEWKNTNNNALESPTSCLQFSDNNIHHVPITVVPSPAGFGENSVLMNPPEVACVPSFMEDLSWINDADQEVFNITEIYNVNDNNNNNVQSSFCSGNLVDNMKYWNTMV